MPHPRQVILETLSQRGALPIDELARATRRSALATRYHLALLIDEGLVAADQVDHQANVGRPQVLYALADQAHEYLPKQYAWLAECLLAEMGDALGAKEKRAFLRRVGKRMAMTGMAARRGARTETRLERVTHFLGERGYMAHWEKTGAEFALHVCNCPYRQVALQHREVCELDLAMIGGLLNLPLKLTACIANQEGRCSFSVNPNEGRKSK